ncbi:hypothetical protein GCM10022215_32570 [Nocardioides fonticola]|uniref:Uncharacterized protein n=1 Tax=Nocardioides fonticola TaxID=450363 RepID=A0ABP7XRU6_9ACTN
MESIHRLADEIREVFSERGHKVETAVGLDPAFTRNKRPESALVRSLVTDAITNAAPRLGVGIVPAPGGAVELAVLHNFTERRLRVLKATRDEETGEFVIIADRAILDISDADPESAFRHERWVLGYTTDDAGMIHDIFAAAVLDVTGDSVTRAVLGPITLLGSGTDPFGGKFQPADDDLPGFDIEVGEDGATGSTEA